MAKNKQFIKINIVGKIFDKKSFNIRTDSKIDIVKRLIIARLKFQGATITPTLDHSYLIDLNYNRFDNDKLISELIAEKKLENDSDISIEISVMSDNNELLSYNCLLDDKLEFGKIDINKKISVINKFNITGSHREHVSSIGSLSPGSNFRRNRKTNNVNPLSPISNHEKKNEVWYVTWDETPINDKDWD